MKINIISEIIIKLVNGCDNKIKNTEKGKAISKNLFLFLNINTQKNKYMFTKLNKKIVE